MQYCDSCGSFVCDCPGFLKSSSFVIEERKRVTASDLISAQIEQKHKARQEIMDWQRREYESWRDSISRDLGYRHFLR